MRTLLAALLLVASVQVAIAEEVEPDTDVSPPCGTNVHGQQICR